MAAITRFLLSISDLTASAARGTRLTAQSTAHVHKVPSFLKTRPRASSRIARQEPHLLTVLTPQIHDFQRSTALSVLWRAIRNISFRPCLHLWGPSSSHARVQSLSIREPHNLGFCCLLYNVFFRGTQVQRFSLK